ncbi:MAG: hypothetical protein IAE77_18575 [Prosthecobacter sp.]|uniref:hypothetical protein n=1 Tax=Prosthecobacter sp. TaxID=1965333 RepID=UPI0019D9A3F4|nr:hypothetical protein [Prosthecobacter sp.]MBE2285473.1 hypothetical protein [Prosthecobacter sp.]
MKLHIVIFAGLVAVAGCGRKPAATAWPLPVVRIEDVPAPATASVVVKKGSNLQTIATDAYGHEDFSGFVASLNGIPDPALVMAGKTLQTPSLAIGIRDAGLDPLYQPAVNVLAKTWMDIRSFLPEYEKQRRVSGVRDGGTFVLGPSLRDQMLRYADSIDAACHVLEYPHANHTAPKSTLGKFSGCSDSLRRFAGGHADSNDYDTFLLQKGFGHGFTYLLIWIKAGHR